MPFFFFFFLSLFFGIQNKQTNKQFALTCSSCTEISFSLFHSFFILCCCCCCYWCWFLFMLLFVFYFLLSLPLHFCHEDKASFYFFYFFNHIFLKLAAPSSFSSSNSSSSFCYPVPLLLSFLLLFFPSHFSSSFHLLIFVRYLFVARERCLHWIFLHVLCCAIKSAVFFVCFVCVCVCCYPS